MEKYYIKSQITTFDEEEELYYTKVGLNLPSMPLHYIVCGKTKGDSIARAIILVDFLNWNLNGRYAMLPSIKDAEKMNGKIK